MSNVKAGVIAFANPFAQKPRIEILLDWVIQPWPPKDWLDPNLKLEYRVYAVAADTPPVSIPGDAKLIKGTEIAVADRAKYADAVRHLYDLGWAASSARTLFTESNDYRTSLLNSRWQAPKDREPLHPPHFSFDVDWGTLEKDMQNREGFGVKIRELANRYVDYAHTLLTYRKNLEDRDARRQLGLSTETPRSPEDAKQSGLQHVLRDELTAAYLFRVMDFLEISEVPDLASETKKLWLMAGLAINGTPLSADEYCPIATRLVASKGADARLITLLDLTMDQANPTYESVWNSFFASRVAVRQRRATAPVKEAAERTPLTGKRAEQVTQQFRDTRSLALILTAQDIEDAANARVGAKKTAKAALTAIEEDRDFATKVGSGFRSMEESDRDFDAISISWDRDDVKPLPADAPKSHGGYKGYRIDVTNSTGKRTSLCAVRREVVDPEEFRYEFPESATLNPVEGYVYIPVQGDPAPPPGGTAASTITIRDYQNWDGYSVVAPNPLDALGKHPETPTDDAPTAKTLPFALLDTASLESLLQYGQTYDVRVRKLGLTELGPRPTDEPRQAQTSKQLKTPQNANSNFLRFLRCVSMAMPELKASLPPTLVPADQSDTLIHDQQQKGSSDSLLSRYRVTSSDSEIRLHVRPPLAHWKVAFHSRDVLYFNDSERFRSACRSFALRQRRGQESPELRPPHTDFLSSVDPYLGHVQLLSRVWYPYSGFAASDRFEVSGVATHDSIAEKSHFVDLIADAENFIEKQDFPFELKAKIAENGESPDLKRDSFPAPVLFQGHRNRVECTGVWQNSAIPFLDPNLRVAMDGSGLSPRERIENLLCGVKRWSSSLLMFPSDDRRRSLIGGKPDAPLSAALQIRYAGLKKVDDERLLAVPKVTNQATPPGGDSCLADPLPSVVRGTALQWRQYFFKIAKDPKDPAKDYEPFLTRMLACRVVDPTTLMLPDGTQKKVDDKSVCITLSPAVAAPPEERYTAFGASLPAEAQAFEAQEIKDPTTKELWPIRQYAVIGLYGDPGKRRLPFVDDEIVWIVRLNWTIPLRQPSVPRPQDLAAVKEFQIYRTTTPRIQPTDKPIGRIERPSDRVFVKDRKNLDEVQWAWMDAIQSRDPQRLYYSIVAIPEFPEAFQPNCWVQHEVKLPSCRFDSLPGPVQVIPLHPEMSGAESVRRIAVFFPTETRSQKAKLAVRIPYVREDPLLPKVQAAMASPAGPALQTKEPSIGDVFPAKTDYDTTLLTDDVYDRIPAPDPYGPVEEKWWFGPDPLSATEQKPPAPDRPTSKDCCFDARPSQAAAANPVWILSLPTNGSAGRELGGRHPFFKLQLAFYSPDNYPRLKHTAASEILETNWLQAYPEQLREPVLGTDQVIRLDNAWRPSNAVGGVGDVLWYRYHFFAVNGTSKTAAAIHLSTIYRPESALAVKDVVPLLEVSLTRFAGNLQRVSQYTKLLVTAEEGFLARTYEVDGDDNPVASDEKTFTVLRGCTRALEIPYRTTAVVAVTPS
jgi:hypothetical protein